MAKKYQTVKQNLNNIIANGVEEAKRNFTIAQVMEEFRHDVKKRIDLSRKFKQSILAQAEKMNYELVYYPVYFYRTESDLSWDTSRSQNTNVYSGLDKVGTLTTTTTTTHTRAGIWGSSSRGRVKREHVELDVETVSEKETSELKNFRALTIPVYEEGLFFNKAENNENIIRVARDSSKADYDVNVSVNWARTKILLVPILRFVFDYNGRYYIFEMNLHNGQFVTRYKQRLVSACVKVLTRGLRALMSFSIMLIPVARLVLGFMQQDLNAPTDNWLLNFLVCIGGLAVLGILEINTIFVFSGARSKLRWFTFERATSRLNPFKYIAGFGFTGLWMLVVIGISLLGGWMMFA